MGTAKPDKSSLTGRPAANENKPARKEPKIFALKDADYQALARGLAFALARLEAR